MRNAKAVPSSRFKVPNDRFGRVTGQTWTNSAETTTFDNFAYTYDRASNRTSKDLTIAAATGLDEKYTYDGLNRLTSYDRGTLDENGDITDKVRNEAWGLSPTGNWSDYQIDADGDGNYTDATDLDQDRTHNLVNEIWNATPGNAITEQADPQQTQWADPVWDARGNMTTAPKPSDLTDTYACRYDAWNRLVEVKDGEATVARYAYDGLNHRVTKTVGATIQHAYYNTGWQLLEARETTDPEAEPEDLDPKEQYVWDVRYIDAPLCRDENKNADNDCTDAEDEHLYYCNDANMNVTALVDASDGTVVERVVYDPYGKATFLAADWSLQENGDVDGISSNYDNEILYCGYHFDTETGLYSVRHRYYHPTLGRWISRDPSGYADSMNLCQYVASNPIVLRDPTGLGVINRLLIWLGIREKEQRAFGRGLCDDESFVPLEPGTFLQFIQRRNLPTSVECENSGHVGNKAEVVIEYSRWRPSGADRYISYRRARWQVECVCCSRQEDPETVTTVYGWKPVQLVSDEELSSRIEVRVPRSGGRSSPGKDFVDDLFRETGSHISHLEGEARGMAGMTHDPDRLSDPDYAEGAFEAESDPTQVLDPAGELRRRAIGGAASAIEKGAE